MRVAALLVKHFQRRGWVLGSDAPGHPQGFFLKNSSSQCSVSAFSDSSAQRRFSGEILFQGQSGIGLGAGGVTVGLRNKRQQSSGQQRKQIKYCKGFGFANS